MKVLELFSGTASFSNVAKERGHSTFTIDNDSSFKPDMVVDISKMCVNDLPLDWQHPDIVWASVPCEKFSVMNIGKNWTTDHRPRNEGTRQALDLLRHTLELIERLHPRLYFIENPVDKMRSLPFMLNHPRRTVTYCQYGEHRRKPTDIWTNCSAWKPRPICKNGSPCHDPAPRGSRQGVQGQKNAVERGKVPRQLCEEILIACELSVR